MKQRWTTKLLVAATAVGLAAIVILSIVQAQTASIITVGNVSASRSEVVSVPISLTSTAMVRSLQMDVDFNGRQLQGAKAGAGLDLPRGWIVDSAQLDADTLRVVAFTFTAQNLGGEILRLNFAVAPYPEFGTSSIIITTLDMRDSANQVVPVSQFTGSSTIATDRYVYLARWAWAVDADGNARWEPPGANRLGALDLRNSAQRAAAGGPPQGWGLFVYRSPQSILGAIPLGSEPDKPLTEAQILAWHQFLGLPRATASVSLRDLMWDVLTVYADSGGDTAPRPIMPTTQHRLELHLGGFQPLRTEAFDLRASTHADQVLAVLQDSYRHTRQEEGQDVARRLLGFWAQQYGMADYRIFIPQDLPDEGIVPPATTITENFNQADSTTLGPTLTWTEVDGDWDTVSNEVNLVTTGGTGPRDARAESALSSTDHYTQINKTAAGANSTGVFLGAACRFAAAAETAYYSKLRGNTTGNDHQSERVEAGTATAIGADTDDGNTGTTRIQCNGSTITRYFNGSLVDTVTDTAITTGTLAGIIGRVNAANNVKGDNFEASDLAAATAQVIII